MARKHLLDGLGGTELTAVNSASAPEAGQGAPAPHLGVMGTRGAIGAVTRSIEQLKAQSVVDLQPDLIEASFITDRLQGTDADHEILMASIKEHGQQVPILVRPHPERDGRFQIAYGRRRLRAIKELGKTVRAVVKPLTDQQLVVAQGQENSARTDLSFIEKALFAAKLEQGGFDRETIMAALSIDKTTLSRLVSSASKIPQDIIEAVGPAPKTGRDRWIELAARLADPAAIAKAQAMVKAESFAAKESDERFVSIFNAAAPQRAAAPRPTVWKAEDGTSVVQIKEDADSLKLSIDKKTAGTFGAYLVENLPEIYAAYKRRADAT
ncbi:MAG: plasmid partitioning protein RepB [Bradyrhizobium sp.]|nr:plasmid partitioning protein RepB [Bradyrhizobium sp.]